MGFHAPPTPSRRGTPRLRLTHNTFMAATTVATHMPLMVPIPTLLTLPTPAATTLPELPCHALTTTLPRGMPKLRPTPPTLSPPTSLNTDSPRLTSETDSSTLPVMESAPTTWDNKSLANYQIISPDINQMRSIDELFI